MKLTNFYTVQYWMTHNLKLRGVERDVYAVIYGFTQDEDTEFKGSISYIAELTGHTRKSVIEAINYLEDTGLIYKIQSSSNVDRRNSYKCDYDIIDEIFDGVDRTPHGVDRTPSTVSIEHQDSVDRTPHKEYIKDEEEIKEEAPAPQALSSKINPKRNFRSEHEQLEDILESGKEIDMQKKERKKLSEFEKCLAEIDKRNFSEEEKNLLRTHLDQSYHSKDPKRIKDRSNYVNKLNMLEQLIKKGNNGLKVIQQSIDRQWSAFYEYSEKQTIAQQHEPLADKVISRSAEEAQKELDALRASGAKHY